ncbi:MAG: hypothetical protein KH334_07840 [Clostridiales bacterium]|nr:hypothetical protein [Clostridiales bacterium]
MRTVVKGKGIDISQYLKEDIEKRSAKMDRYFREETELCVFRFVIDFQYRGHCVVVFPCSQFVFVLHF